MKRLVAVLAVGITLAACSQSTGGGAAEPPPPEPEPQVLDPVGVYDISTSVEGQPVTGTMTIAGSPGAYTGTMTTGMTGTVPLRSIEVDGMELYFLMDIPEATVAFLLTFEGDSFSGEWDAEGMIGVVTGTRR